MNTPYVRKLAETIDESQDPAWYDSFIRDIYVPLVNCGNLEIQLSLDDDGEICVDYSVVYDDDTKDVGQTMFRTAWNLADDLKAYREVMAPIYKEHGVIDCFQHEAAQSKPNETVAACQCCGVMVSESHAHGPDNVWLCGECYSSGLVQAAQLLRDNQDSWLKHFGSFDEYDVFEFKAEIMADHPGAVFTFEDVMDLALRLAPSSESAA